MRSFRLKISLRSKVLGSKGIWTMNYAGTAIGKLLNGGHGAKIGACHAKYFAISRILLLGNVAVANTPQSKNIDRHLSGELTVSSSSEDKRGPHVPQGDGQ
jgi:hypothetical protein